MSRSLSSSAVAAVNAQETGEVFLILLTIDHDDLAEPIRVVSNNQDVTSNGNTFVGYPFEISLPQDDAEQVPTTRIRIDNVDRRIVDTIRLVSSPPTMTLQVVLASTPDTVELSFGNMTLREVEYDALVVEGTVQYEDVLHQAFPYHRFTPSSNPGLF